MDGVRHEATTAVRQMSIPPRASYTMVVNTPSPTGRLPPVNEKATRVVSLAVAMKPLKATNPASGR